MRTFMCNVGADVFNKCVHHQHININVRWRETSVCTRGVGGTVLNLYIEFANGTKVTSCLSNTLVSWLILLCFKT